MAPAGRLTSATAKDGVAAQPAAVGQAPGVEYPRGGADLLDLRLSIHRIRAGAIFTLELAISGRYVLTLPRGDREQAAVSSFNSRTGLLRRHGASAPRSSVMRWSIRDEA